MTRWLLSRRGFLAASALSAESLGMGRTPLGGRLRLGVPWPITSLDPASLLDGFSALVASSVFEPLYGLDAAGAPYPALAEALPVKLAAGCRVTLRPGLRSARGALLTGADLVATLSRARSRGAAGLLGEIEDPVIDPADRFSVVFARSAPDVVGRVLSSPLLALVPKTFSPLSPDATGAFQATLSNGRALLSRNLNATRGAAFLDAVELASAPDLTQLLRGFETGETDVGWFGSGLYRASKDGVSFEAPRYGFAVLCAGKAVGPWGAPGTLQALLDAVPESQLSHLGLRGLPARATGSATWGGPATTIAVMAGSPQLIAVAGALSATLSTPGHQLQVVEKTPAELADLRASRQYGLLVDGVRAPSVAPREIELALRTAASPEAARHAPKTAPLTPRELGRQLPLGVIGELSVWGTRRAPLVGLESWQLGAVWLRPT